MGYKDSKEGYQQTSSDSKVHTVVVEMTDECSKLGLDIYVSSKDKVKKVAKVKDAGLIPRHNQQFPDRAIYEDDGIESVNGVSWPQKLFFDEIKNAKSLVLIVNRGQYKQ